MTLLVGLDTCPHSDPHCRRTTWEYHIPDPADALRANLSAEESLAGCVEQVDDGVRLYYELELAIRLA